MKSLIQGGLRNATRQKKNCLPLRQSLQHARTPAVKAAGTLRRGRTQQMSMSSMGGSTRLPRCTPLAIMSPQATATPAYHSLAQNTRLGALLVRPFSSDPHLKERFFSTSTMRSSIRQNSTASHVFVNAKLPRSSPRTLTNTASLASKTRFGKLTALFSQVKPVFQTAQLSTSRMIREPEKQFDTLTRDEQTPPIDTETATNLIDAPVAHTALETGAMGTSYMVPGTFVYRMSEPGAGVLEWLHHISNTPWWATVIIATFSLRFALLPFVYKVLENQSKMNLIQPFFLPLQDKLREAPTAAEKEKIVRLISALFAKHKMHPLKSLLWTLPQIPFMFLMFWGLYRTAVYSPEVTTQGLFWFQNLSEPDLGGRLPLLTAFLVWVNFLINVDRTLPPEVITRHALTRRIFVFISLLTIGLTRYFPMLIHLYIFTTTLITLLQSVVLKYTPLTKVVPGLADLHRPYRDIESEAERRKRNGFNVEEYLQEWVDKIYSRSRDGVVYQQSVPNHIDPQEGDSELQKLKQQYEKLMEEMETIKTQVPKNEGEVESVPKAQAEKPQPIEYDSPQVSAVAGHAPEADVVEKKQAKSHLNTESSPEKASSHSVPKNRTLNPQKAAQRRREKKE